MPIYEYVCDDCGCQFELLRPVSSARADAPCRRCGKPARRKMSGFASLSKGSDSVSVPVSGAGGGCAGCSSTSCSTCA